MVGSVPIPTLLSLARYNRWAYKQLLDGLRSVSDKDYYGNAGLVFRSIHGTLNHLHAADVNWWSRLTNQYGEDFEDIQSLWRDSECYSTKESEKSPWESFVKDRSELSKRVLQKAQDYIDFLSSLDEDADIPPLSFVTSSGVELKDQDAGLTILHVFNHATHHRGQITAGVTNLGYPPIDGLDYLYFLRKDKQ
ncbi:DinB family protein [Umbelopsis sp. PMI_123]|nr:DinB family protein [Umbelopsis sp. PMI_123]